MSYRRQYFETLTGELLNLGLSKREIEVAIEMASDLSTNGEIAERLCITVSAVKHHITSLNRKFGTRNRMEILKKLYDMVSDRMAKDLAVLGPTGVTLWKGRNNGTNESHSA